MSHGGRRHVDEDFSIALPPPEEPHETSVHSANPPSFSSPAIDSVALHFRDYIGATAARLLFELPEPEPTMMKVLDGPEAKDTISKFVGDARVPALYFMVRPRLDSKQRRRYALSLDFDVGNESALPETCSASPPSSPSSPSSPSPSPLVGGMVLAFIKRNAGALQDNVPLSTQLQIITLNGGGPAPNRTSRGGGEGGERASLSSDSTAHATFALLQQYTRYSFTPLVKSLAVEARIQQEREQQRLVEGKEGAAGQGPPQRGHGSLNRIVQARPAQTDERGMEHAEKVTSKSLRILQRKLVELDLALGQCQTATEIPGAELIPHPVIQRALQEANTLGPGEKRDGELDVSRLDLEEVGLPEYLLRDDTFLNQLQSTVNAWVVDIQHVTRLASQTAFPGSAAAEMGFWASMEEALRRIQEQLVCPGVQLTVLVLKQARRMIPIASLENNTGMASAQNVVEDVMGFMRDLPLQGLVAAASYAQLGAALEGLFHHMGKLKTCRYYDVERAGKLYEAISEVFAAQLSSVVAAQQGAAKLLGAPGSEEEHMRVEHVLACWKRGARKFEEMYLELLKKRVRGGASGKAGSGMGGRVQGLQESEDLVKLQERLGEVAKFRGDHARFSRVLDQVLGGEEAMQAGKLDDREEEVGLETRRDVAAAYARVLSLGVGVLDLTVEGLHAWRSALEAYNHQIGNLESRILRLLCTRLETSASAEDMFRVFARFHPLVNRPRIRAAIAQYQAMLIAHVRDAVQKLQETFTARYEGSEAQVLATLRDVPPVAGKILWARLLERQLLVLMARLEEVLGEGWEKHVDGKQLKEVCEELIRKLNAEPLFAAWVRETHDDVIARGTKQRHVQQHQEEEQQVLVVHRNRNGVLFLRVNYDEQTVVLFKEVRHMQWLGFRIPAAIRIIAEKAAERYPYAMALQASLQAFEQTLKRLSYQSKGKRGTVREGNGKEKGGFEHLPGVELEALLDGHLKAVRETLNETFPPEKGKEKADRTSSSIWPAAIRWDTIPPALSAHLPSVPSSHEDTPYPQGAAPHAFGKWVTGLSERVFLLQEKTEDLLAFLQALDSDLHELQACPYAFASFRRLLNHVQHIIDNMNMAGYAHMEDFVQRVERVVIGILTLRLQHALEAWVATFQDNSEESRKRGVRQEQLQQAGEACNFSCSMALQPSFTGVLKDHQHQRAPCRPVKQIEKEQVRVHHRDTSSQISESTSPIRIQPQLHPDGKNASSRHASQPRVPFFPVHPPLIHKISLQNQTLYLSPPLQLATTTYINHLHQLIGVVGRLSRLEHSRFDFLEGGQGGVMSPSRGRGERGGRARRDNVGAESKTFATIPRLVPPMLLKKAYECVQTLVRHAEEYVEEWLRYQALWDMTPERVYSFLEGRKKAEVGKGGHAHPTTAEDLHAWIRLLAEMKNARASIAMSPISRRCFGPSLVIDYGLVQGQVNLKYDAWQKHFQARFGRLLAEACRATHAQIKEDKSRLEAVALMRGREGLKSAQETRTGGDGSEKLLADVVFVANGQSTGPRFARMVTALEAGERTLRRQRYTFPSDWLQVSVLLGTLGDFNQILDRRRHALEAHLPALQHKVRLESEKLSARIEALMEEWEREKPAAEMTSPEMAITVLKKFENALANARLEHVRLDAAKEALGLDKEGVVKEGFGDGELGNISAPTTNIRGGVHRRGMDPLVSLEKEIYDLHDVWKSLQPIYATIQAHIDTPWSAVQPRHLRNSLDTIQESLRALPNRVRQYEACTHLQGRVKKYKSLFPLVSDLKTEALKERHWRKLLKKLEDPSLSSSGLSPATSLPAFSGGPFEHLTLGYLWSVLDPALHRHLVTEALSSAQGEMALEIFLKQVRETWESWEVELSNNLYRGRIRLIRGWDAVFARLEDHLGALAAIKSSPYYEAVPEFQQAASAWEEKLCRLKSLFDVWIAVQKKWVYLEGIFLGGASADIKNQLPSEHARFKALDMDFVGLLRRVAAAPQLLGILKIEQIQPQLERHESTLAKIQKALGSYLKRERAAFPRFCFVGDDDLLEIVGNASEPHRVTQHLSKMFASIAQVRLEEVEKGEDQQERRNDSQVMITTMISKEGEEVGLREPVVFAPAKTAVRDWLQALESEMRETLSHLLADAIKDVDGKDEREEGFVSWVESYPTQVVLLAVQVTWTRSVEAALMKGKVSSASSALEAATALKDGPLASLSTRLLASVQYVLAANVHPQKRKKFEHLITELVHQRDVIRSLVSSSTASPEAYAWLQYLRYYWDPPKRLVQNDGDHKAASAQGKGNLHVQIANADFEYGFEYLGMAERLVETPLTHKCYLTLSQALLHKMGGNPFGPAGTGKTESVKALGAAIGRFVLVFNCDERFDFSAMGRLLAGLCQVGAWGCFDEFNRLEERILSAVSQQIMTIQRALASGTSSIDLLKGGEGGGGDAISLHQNVGVFITMNPGYAGRSHLPDNLKALFRSIAMTAPDNGMIAEVMLFAQGLETAEKLAKKVVMLFQLCGEQFSKQVHYDFGLRALKTVLVGAGGLKRKMLGSAGIFQDRGMQDIEARVLIESACTTVLPKLVGEDVAMFKDLLRCVFPTGEKPGGQGGWIGNMDPDSGVFRKAVVHVCKGRGLIPGQGFMEKVLQLRGVLALRHGVMLVGSTGSGKTSAWQVLLEAEALVGEGHGAAKGRKGEAYVIEPKALSKEELFGVLDKTTLEWKDGVFTSLIRQILENARGEQEKSHWVVFDGDVDPEWAENLNSVLDDNRLLSLPNGERLELPPHVRILLEVDSLGYATPATVSRCGMVWFAEGNVTETMLIKAHMERLKRNSCNSPSGEPLSMIAPLLPTWTAKEGKDVEERDQAVDVLSSRVSPVQSLFVQTIEPWVLGKTQEEGQKIVDAGEGLVYAALHFSLEEAAAGNHVMVTERGRLLETFFSLLKRGIALAVEYDEEAHPEATRESSTKKGIGIMLEEHIEAFALRYLLFAALWGLGSSLGEDKREALSALLLRYSPWPLPAGCSSLLALQVRVQDGEWIEWAASVPRLVLDARSVLRSDLVIPTTDTLRHTDIIRAWLSSRQPLLLCGPPGSGKSITLMSTLQSMPNVSLAALNFSSGTGPELLMKTFAQHCEYVQSPRGVVLQPTAALGGQARGTRADSRWLVIFCDEINLPERDRYGTQRVIALLRQCVEQGGFWRTQDNAWVSLNRIQFVGACNPPTDAGRVPLSLRFLRHAPVLLVDSPSPPSLRQIYRTYTNAILRHQPSLGGFVDPVTDAMLDLYFMNQRKFRPDVKPQYVYSPRELSRWVRALHEALGGGEDGEIGADGSVAGGELVRIWAHEGLRLFCDRLVTEEEQQWCHTAVDEVATRHFPTWTDGKREKLGEKATGAALARPILYSKWISKRYQSVGKEDLKAFVAARLKTFYEEELDVPLVIFDDVLEHVLRIDRVLRQSMGHMLLVGESGVGKTVLSRFVAWLNGLSIFQVKASYQYTLDRFDEDLRFVLKRAGTGGEKICFIFDESNALSSAFLERMNALLASGEVPGLFEGEEYQSLIASCRAMSEVRGNSQGVGGSGKNVYGHGLLGSSPTEGGGRGTAGDEESEEELYRRFVRNVQRNLHVIFTMNPSGQEEEVFASRSSTSPALFNRCVIDWFGTWSSRALAEVAHAFTLSLDLGGGEVALTKACNGQKGKAEALMEVVEFLYDSENDARKEEDIPSIPPEDSACVSAKNPGGVEPQPTVHHTIVAALVATHRTAKQVIEHVEKAERGGRSRGKGRRNFLSPRDFLDLIRNFVSVMGEKRSRLEDQQLHINMGLEKFAATQKDVKERQAALARKKIELSRKDAMANQKLRQMVEDQNEAERKKASADQVAQELSRQNETIAGRRKEVENELAEAEPALLGAQKAVNSIKKAHLDEVRVLARPPNPVRLTLEAVLILLGEEKRDWNDVRKVIRRDDFIATVVNFDPEGITPKQVKDLQDLYLGLEEFEYDAVQRASTACGPLNKWVVSLLNYSAILRRVQPLREEVAALQMESEKLQDRQTKIEGEITLLENSIALYKAEYAQAIRDIEGIKGEMDVVANKVKRAEALLASFASEKERWHASSASFQRQLSSLAGDALLSAAFLTYAGIFDYKYRQRLLAEWASILSALRLSYRPDLSLTDYLAHPTQQLAWASHGLPNDQLCLENAIILERAQHRYPLVIDPSGQATKFLLQKFASRKVQTTSFADGAFLKVLASAVRFGTPLLIQDVEERIDPLLNPVLNKEFQRTGGRTLLRLGNEDIDFSPQFFVVLITRNSSARFPPDLCSRVSLVNFTDTPASLCSQALSRILRTERPDVDKRRTEILRLQGEQNVRLRELEEGLLTEISAAECNILDDDRVLKALEELKAEAADLEKDVASTTAVMDELKYVSDVYEPFALAVTQVFFVMERLASVHFLYQYPTQYLLSILDNVLARSPPDELVRKKGKDQGTQERIKDLELSFFAEVCRRVSKGLLQEDQLAFALRLTLIHLQGAGQDREGRANFKGKEERLDSLMPTEEELECLYKGPFSAASSGLVNFTRKEALEGAEEDEYLIPGIRIDITQAKELRALSLLPSFAFLLPAVSRDGPSWVAFMTSPRPENEVPDFDVALPVSTTSTDGHAKDMLASMPGVQNTSTLPATRRAFLHLLLLKALRPDRLMFMMETYVSSVLGEDFPWRGLFDLAEVVREQSTAARPILLSAEAGFDASRTVDSLAEAEGGKGLRSVAMGSVEGYALADRYIAAGAQRGTWVLLRNIHLCPHWLEKLERRLHNLSQPHPSFRLFLTSEIHPGLPSSLLRLSDVMVLEAPTGVKSHVLRLLYEIPAPRLDSGCVEKARLFFLVAWLHAILQERLRYLPWGWSRKYEFTQADALAALDVVEDWIEREGGRDRKQPSKDWHISPEDIPWAAIQSLLGQSVYGGKVENIVDQAVLESFISDFFRPACFDMDFPLVSDLTVSLPEGDAARRGGWEGREGRRADYMAWLEDLPSQNSTTWLGLAASVEADLSTAVGARIARKVGDLWEDVVRDVVDPEECLEEKKGVAEARMGQKASLSKALLQRSQEWLARIQSLVPGIKPGVLTPTPTPSPYPLAAISSAAPSSDDSHTDDPLRQCLRRNMEVGKEMILRVQEDLNATCRYLEQTLGDCHNQERTQDPDARKSRAKVEATVTALSLDEIPGPWRALHPRGAVDRGVGAWITDSIQRVEHGLALLSKLEKERNRKENISSALGGVWLGALYNPEAFMTATRQVVATQMCCSLEELDLAVEIKTPDNNTEQRGRDNAFAVVNLTLEGADLEEGQLSLSSGAIRSQLPLAWLLWHKVGPQERETRRLDGKADKDDAPLVLPLYLDESRATLIARMTVAQREKDPRQTAAQWAQRGVALVASRR